MVDRAKTTHVEINLRSRQNNDIKLHANNTARTATCHLQQTAPKRRMSTLILDQGITAQRNKVACKQQGNHMVMQQEGTSNKHQGLQRRATSSCCYDITLRQPVDTQTYRYINRQKEKSISRKGEEESTVDGAKTTHVEINLRSRQNNDITLHANNTARTATCHLLQTAPKIRMSKLT